MAIDPEELVPKKQKTETIVGQDISTLSVTELERRIAALEEEIVRTRQALTARAATKDAAESVFKR